MYAVVRRYPDAGQLIDVMQEKPNEVEEVIGGVPGVIAYHAIRSGDTLLTISVCQDQSSTAETTRRAGEWVRANVPSGGVGSPEVTSGEVFINLAAPRSVGARSSMAEEGAVSLRPRDQDTDTPLAR